MSALGNPTFDWGFLDLSCMVCCRQEEKIKKPKKSLSRRFDVVTFIRYSMAYCGMPEAEKLAPGLVPCGVRLDVRIEDRRDTIAEPLAAREQI